MAKSIVNNRKSGSNALFMTTVGFGVLLAMALFGRAPTPLEINDVGPAVGDNATVYLFQSYDCQACGNLTLGGELDELFATANEVGAKIVWKNVATGDASAALASHCLWQEFPTRWLEWNHAAFLRQYPAGAGWTADGILFLTESTLLLSQGETQKIERCLFEEDWMDQINGDTLFWNEQAPIPALYANGAWKPATSAGLRNLIP